MGRKLTIPYYRPAFIQKEIGEVGDGTAWPMLVTIDQLAEVMYRVRDAKWISGNAGRVAYNIDEDPSYYSDVTFTAVAPPSEKVEWELQPSDVDAAYTRRGYVAVTNEEAPDGPLPDYDAGLFSVTQYLTTGGISTDPTSPLSCREAIDELAIWANGFIDTEPLAKIGHYPAGEVIDTMHFGEAPNDTFKTGFSFYGASWTDSFVEPSIYAPVGYFGFDGETMTPYERGVVAIEFSGEVAWVDENGSGDPLDPLNKLYLGIVFSIIDPLETALIAGPAGLASLSTDTSRLDNPSTAGADLKLKLAGPDYITAPIYFSMSSTEYNAYRFEVHSITDWVFHATKWWPYADAAGDPIWNENTGAKL